MLTDEPIRHAHARALRTRGQRIKRGDRRTLKREFLRLYTATGATGESCAHVGIVKSTLHGWLHRDPAFAAAYNAIGTARFEAEMAALERRYPIGNAEDYVQHLTDGRLAGAMKRLWRRGDAEKWW